MQGTYLQVQKRLASCSRPSQSTSKREVEVVQASHDGKTDGQCLIGLPKQVERRDNGTQSSRKARCSFVSSKCSNCFFQAALLQEGVSNESRGGRLNLARRDYRVGRIK